MKIPVILLLSLLFTACTTVPGTGPSTQWFQDASFNPPSERIRAEDVFAVSEEMKRYVATEIAGQVRSKGQQQALIDALYDKNQLKVEYDSAITRNAAQAFRDRSGNCLSLVIMTAAFAREMGLGVRYQNVMMDETWSRGGGMHLSVGHVNLTLAHSQPGPRADKDEIALLTIDFVPPDESRHLRTLPLDENTVIALYMNNRAVESLVRGKLDDAYWWAREGIRQDPSLLASYVTLGVIYRRHGQLDAAEKVLRHVLERDPHETKAMTNLVVVLDEQGRVEESKVLEARLDLLQPNPPFHYFNLGMEAMKKGDFRVARADFEKELRRDPYNHEFHFWLAIAHLRLGEVGEARSHLDIAVEFSPTRSDRDLYAAKLDKIKSLQ